MFILPNSNNWQILLRICRKIQYIPSFLMHSIFIYSFPRWNLMETKRRHHHLSYMNLKANNDIDVLNRKLNSPIGAVLYENSKNCRNDVKKSFFFLRQTIFQIMWKIYCIAANILLGDDRILQVECLLFYMHFASKPKL